MGLLRVLSLGLCLLLVGVGCVSARMSDHESDRLFRSGDYEQAAVHLKQGLKKQGDNGRDVLLYLLDLGLALHSVGKFEESNQIFLKADRVAEIKDYTSLAAEGATLLTSENLKDYKAEDFENVLISTYLAMNYALMGNSEEALVEARRVNRKLYLMVTEGKRKYKQNAFARYLSAILYEADGNFNDAYIDYQNTWKLRPDFPGLGKDLWRCAWQLGMRDKMEEWDEAFLLTKEDHLQAQQLGPRSKKGEVIIFYENGISPVKRPNPSFASLPKFYPRFNPVSFAEVEVNGEVKGVTSPLESIEATAIENLDEKYGGLIVKKIAGVVAKESLAYGIARKTNSPLLGLLARAAFYVSDQADLRSWNLLPKDFQILRVTVDPGTYVVRVKPQGLLPLPEKRVQVGSGKKVFMNFRYTP